MVQTRRQWRQWAESGYPSDNEDECEACSQRSIDNAYDYNDNEAPQQGPRYTVNDRCRRHRARDDEEYSTVVSGYRRRKPL